MPNPADYTVGWICAVSTEYVAAQCFLDEEHDAPESVASHDNNDYTLGKVGKHNVVIAVLPNGEYGKARAASVASDMLHSFPNVRIGLMVGIGGGAPSQKHDIRLADIVVSASKDGKTAILQYDFGKTIQDRAFERTGITNQPPPILRAAVNGLMAQYERKGNQIRENVDKVLQENRRLRKRYCRPHISSDRLYLSTVVHPDDCLSCESNCGTDLSNLVARPERTDEDDDPAIYYGVIASGDQLMKDALVRDRLARDEEVLCFEMEAAGLMNHFPCLIIRGICDYSDSHKNKEWQGYAALVAAAYAKDLLCRISPNKVEVERKLTDVISELNQVAQDHRDVARDHRDIAKEMLRLQNGEAQRKLSKEEQECHQIFRLTTDSKDNTYEWYKDRVTERVEHTCVWFLEHDRFQLWLKQDSGPLIVSADPGCGKTVLAKYLIDHAFPKLTTVCYFFFTDQDQNTVRQALCALLHQLFCQNPALITHVMESYKKNGPKLIYATSRLWEIFLNAANDPSAGAVTVVLDALDECAETELQDLMRKIDRHFSGRGSNGSKLKFIMTCRPYYQILSGFRGLLQEFPSIHIPGEEQSEAISQEVNQVIKYRVSQLSMNDSLKLYLEERLRATHNRTYLWVYLVFDYLENEVVKKTLKEVKAKIEALPSSLNEAYDNILSKTKEDKVVYKALSIVLAAKRPLTVAEMNVAMNVAFDTHSMSDLDLENDVDFKKNLRFRCGLFLSVHHDRIYLLHQTAREFLLADLTPPTDASIHLRWHRSITFQGANSVLAEICVLSLTIWESDDYQIRNSGQSFMDYPLTNWGDHFREADFQNDATIIPFTLRLCDPTSKAYSHWARFQLSELNGNVIENIHFSHLMIVSYHGHKVLAKVLLDKGSRISDRDDLGWPLFLAVAKGHEPIVKLLLNQGADANTIRGSGNRPLLYVACSNGYGGIVELLLDKGADVELRIVKRIALHQAAIRGHVWCVKLMLERLAVTDTKTNHDQRRQEILLLATECGRKEVVKMLLDTGVDIETRAIPGRKPLAVAIKSQRAGIVKLLLDRGADPRARDKFGATALNTTIRWYGTRYRLQHQNIAKMLLDVGAEVNTRDNNNDTPLIKAVQTVDEKLVELLIDRGAEVAVINNKDETPLSLATKKGHTRIMTLIQERLEESRFKELRSHHSSFPR
ncbi:hypothetical protein FOWG_04277 [Fusarium oxysporum f. sp. lycopersici MN25]|nr:hypothetical protein FOWG_04277 [Fusarium oxysporum f. sp. lycopersici MN25]